LENPSPSQQPFPALPRLFYGWWIVLVSMITDGVKQGSFNRGFTVYIIPIQNGLGLSAAAIGWADTLGRLMGGIQGPFMGYMTDRLGPGPMLAFGGITSGLGFILLSYTGNYFFFLLVFVGLMSVGFRSGYNNASIAAINNWFRRRRGLAMSLVSMGHGFGGAIAPVAGWMVLTYGWEIAVRISGVAIILLVVPLSFMVKRSPESMGLLPDGDLPEDGPGKAEARRARATGDRASGRARGRARWTAPENDFTAREAMRTPSYWMLVLAAGLRNTAHSGLSFLLAPVMVWFLQQGGREQIESLQIAAFFVGLVAFATVIFNPMIGWLGDRFPRQRLSALCMTSGAIALCLLFNTGGSLWLLAAFAILQALSESANSLNWALMGEFFGRRSFATLRGWQHLPDQLVSMWTAVWMGLIYDATGSYYLALFPLIGILALAALTFLLLPRPRLPDRLRARATAESASPVD
jgi:sugar phosphate permease